MVVYFSSLRSFASTFAHFAVRVSLTRQLERKLKGRIYFYAADEIRGLAGV